MICQNPYCEAEATHKAPHNEHYCSECIHGHVYNEHDPDPASPSREEADILLRATLERLRIKRKAS